MYKMAIRCAYRSRRACDGSSGHDPAGRRLSAYPRRSKAHRRARGAASATGGRSCACSRRRSCGWPRNCASALRRWRGHPASRSTTRVRSACWPTRGHRAGARWRVSPCAGRCVRGSNGAQRRAMRLSRGKRRVGARRTWCVTEKHEWGTTGVQLRGGCPTSISRKKWQSHQQLADFSE